MLITAAAITVMFTIATAIVITATIAISLRCNVAGVATAPVYCNAFDIVACAAIAIATL